MEKYVGFYWTLPVGWLGFRDLPKDAEQAAKKSKTIRYQRAVVQNWLKWQNEGQRPDNARHQLIGEVTYIDKRPDRPTHAFLLDSMKRAGREAVRLGARLVIVEFGTEYTQIRSIRGLGAELKAADVPVELLPVEPVMLDGKLFHPHQHFLEWRERDAAGKLALLERAICGLREAISHFGADGDCRYQDISRLLNDRGIRTPTGRAWTAENVRKVIKRGAWKGSPSRPGC
jgi:hypothetical protein